MKKLLVLMLLAVSPAFGAVRYLDCTVGSSGNGQSWATAWKALSNITGLVAGDEVRIAGPCTFTTSQWNPIGSAGAQIHYRVAQTNDATDNGHTGAVVINLTGSPGMFNTSGSTIAGIWIDGNRSDGVSNMTLEGALGVAGTFWNGTRLSYLTMDRTQMQAGVWENVEVDHNTIDLPVNNDHFSTWSGSGGTGASGYALNSVHDNRIIVRGYPGANPNCGGLDGTGDDGFQWNSNTTLANNVFTLTYTTSYTSCQHLDYLQTGGSFIDVHGNYFENAGNYSVYGDCFGSSSHWRVYNNVSVSTNTDVNGPTLKHFSIGFESTSGSTIDDVVIANNTCFNAVGSNTCASLGAGATGNKVTNSFIANNIEFRTGTESVPGTGGSITVANNFSGTAGVTFVQNPTTGLHIGSYPNGDLHLQASSTSAIDQGVNPAPSYLTSIYTTDKDGVTRPQGSAWDLGAYEFLSGTAPAVSLTCPGACTALTFSGQNLSTTSPGQVVTLTNTGSAVLGITSIGDSGTNAAEYFEATNCPVGSTLGIGSSCTITVTFTPVATGSRTATVSIVDTAANSPQSISLSGTGIQVINSSVFNRGVTLRGGAVLK
jgi:hypothetical protein